MDMMVGSGTATGTVAGGGSGPLPFSASYFGTDTALRLGAQLPWEHVSLAAGSGVGGALWYSSGVQVGQGSASQVLSRPDDIVGGWYVPMWSSLTIKPSCNWGVQTLASYDVRPSDVGASSLAFAIGLLWQPSDACSEPAGVNVTP